MSKIFFIFLLLLIFIFIIFNFVTGDFILVKNNNRNFNASKFSILFLGKPGPGYIGSENTDSIIVFHYDQLKNKIFLIPVPRDLIIKETNGNLNKINALYGEKKTKLLLEKISKLTGFQLESYFVFDLALVTKLIDFIGGIEVDLQEPITDSVTLYTIPAGKQKLNGYLSELVLRSRYHREGDFFRIKNQIKIIEALKNKLITINTKEKLDLIRFLDANRYDWQTNLSKTEILALITKFRNIENLEIHPIIVDFNSGLLKSGYFSIYNNKNIYGIYPAIGIDNFNQIRNFIQSQVK